MSDDHPHLHKTGHSRLDLMLGIAALLMSGVSLYIAMHHGRTMEKLVTAATWPYVQLSTSNADADGNNTRLLFTATNSGVGPARIIKAVMTYDGKPVSKSSELLKACCESAGDLKRKVVFSSISHLVISGQQKVDYLIMPRSTDSEPLYALFDQAREKVNMSICYCSVFDECWITDSEATEPRTVKNCDALQGMAYAE